ncbi:hypothetical protein [Bremerella sp.]|uniref:hypothetical protein n=1 Tax=Bremerella sp. TaxID=2795602 RepID=UPI00391CF595
MSRQFSIATMLRMVPNELLQEFFSVLGHADFDPDWEHLGQREFDPLLDYITDLPTSQAGEFDQELQAVYELSCQSGMTAIAEAAKLLDMAELPLQMPQEMSVHGRAMWTRLRHPKVFETAQLLHEIDHLSWWRKRNDLPSTTPNTSPEAIEALERAISSLLKDQGRGRLCTVETYTRDNVHYFFAYPDDYSETANQHDDNGNLVPIVINKTMQVVFAYHSKEGSMETYAKLPKRMKEGLEGCFSECILNWKLGEHVPGKTFEMNQLKDPHFHLVTDPQDRVTAELVKMRLAHKTNGRKVDLAVDRTIDGESIHKAIEQTIRTEASPLSQWNVIAVAIHFEFLPKAGRKPGRQTITVSFPNTCNVRSERSERVEIIQKYLKRWKIDCGRPTPAGSMAVGA